MLKKALFVLGVLALGAVAAVLIMSCGQSGGKGGAKTSGKVIATVGSASITDEDFNEILKRIPPFNRKRYTTKAGKMELIDKLVEEELFYQEALRKGMDKDKEFAKRLDQIRRGILASMIKKDLYEADIPVTEAEIKDYFTKNPDKFQTPETAKVKLILVRLKRNATDKETAEAKAKADAAYKKLKGGAAWEKVVEEYSDDRASKKKDGLLPAVRKGLRGEEFDKVAFAMTKSGQISEVFQDKRGFNILQFVEKEDAKLKDYEEVKKTIERRLKQEKQKEKMDSTMKSLREKAAVKINEGVLDAIQVETGPETPPGAPGMPGMPGAPGGLPEMGGGEKDEDEEGEAGDMQEKLQQMMKAQQGGAPKPAAPPKAEEKK